MIQKCLELVLIPFIRLMLLIYFRQIEVVGKEKVPHALPLIYTPNHLNSVVDGLLARVFLPRDPRPLAKATLWDITLIRPLLVAAHAIPVYRQQDSVDSSYVSQNRDTFSACYEALAEKSCIVLFPEGQSHSESELQELKTGAARIALGAEQQSGPLGVRIVPVGLNFDAKQKFRSRVLIAIGDPLDPLEGLDGADPGDRDAVGHVMAAIERGIKSVTLNYPSWEEANVIRRAADLYASNSAGGSESDSMADQFSVQKQLADAYSAMKDRYPRKVARIVEAVSAYDRLLKVLSIRHEHVIQQHPRLLQVIFSLRKFSLFVIRLPLALLGIFLNAAPYYLTRLVSRIKVQPDRASTTKIVAGAILYPLCWTLQAMLLGSGLVPPFAWWMLAPLSGISSLLFRERHAQLLEELRTYLKLNGHAEMKAELEQRLETIQLEVAEFLAIAISAQAKAGQPAAG
jgi:1-acyl-sn-glycerol-3-phosphate acyltransferase